MVTFAEEAPKKKRAVKTEETTKVEEAVEKPKKTRTKKETTVSE